MRKTKLISMLFDCLLVNSILSSTYIFTFLNLIYLNHFDLYLQWFPEGTILFVHILIFV